MKFIVNSEYFRKRIQEAIEAKAHYFETENDDIFFLTRANVVTLHVHPLERSNEREPFEIDKWMKIAAELQKLPEQPITVELSYNQIEIYCVMVMSVTDQL